MKFTPIRQDGFSLIELAIVLVIVALLSGGLMMTLSAQKDGMATSETQSRLREAQEALLGYVAANGRLPCPASPGATGNESPPVGGLCTHPYTGLLPAITLGLTPTDPNGYLLDGWNNPIRYAVTTYNHATFCPNGCFTTGSGVRNVWNGSVGTLLLAPDLQVCSTAVNIQNPGAPNASCAPGTELTTNAVIVIFSRGPNGATVPVRADEQANSDNDRVFVSHTLTSAGPNEFDDLVTWISPNILFSRLIAAGRLP